MADLKTEDGSIAQTPAPAASEEDTLTAALVDDEPEPVAETAPAEEVAETPAETPAAETTEPPAAEVAAEPVETPAETPAPGTPNKALQAAQQNQATLERKLDALLEKIGTGAATPQQVQQVQSLQAKAAEVADEVSGLIADGYEIDPFSDTKKVVKKVVGQDHRITALEARLQQAETRAQAAEEQTRWATVEAKYPGVDVRAKWSEARAAAQAEGFEADLEKRANQLFHEYAKAAGTKPAAAAPAPVPPPKAPAATKPAPATARKAPPTTPGGASVTVSGAVSRPAQLNEEAQTEALAKALWR